MWPGAAALRKAGGSAAERGREAKSWTHGATTIFF
jgi:hypothetical protein